MYEYLFNSFIIPNYKKNACGQPNSGTGAREYPPTTLPPQKINISDSCCGKDLSRAATDQKNSGWGKLHCNFFDSGQK
jgi:hypothetical protein